MGICTNRYAHQCHCKRWYTRLKRRYHKKVRPICKCRPREGSFADPLRHSNHVWQWQRRVCSSDVSTSAPFSARNKRHKYDICSQNVWIAGACIFAATSEYSLCIENANDIADMPLAVVTYDIMLTFSREVNCIWRRKWNLVTVVYVVCRYGTFLDLMLRTLGSFYIPDAVWVGVSLFPLRYPDLLKFCRGKFRNVSLKLLGLIKTCQVQSFCVYELHSRCRNPVFYCW